MAVDFRSLPFIPVWEILKCSSVWFSNASGLSCAENTWSVTETVVWHKEHLVFPNFEPVTVVSGDQVLVAGMVKSLSVYSAENQPWAEVLEAASPGIISLEHLLLPNPTNGAGGDAGQQMLWSGIWNESWRLQRCGMCKSPSKETIKEETLLSEREAVGKLCFYQNNKGNFSHSVPSARVNSQGDDRSEDAQTEDTAITELSKFNHAPGFWWLGFLFVPSHIPWT